MTLTPAMAQDIYKMETLSSEDLNGTARFVGMGGSMGSLGADISTMGTNPAGIALFRRSDVSMTGGFHTQADAVDFMSLGKTRASFDQIGFVYACPIDDDVKFINFGFITKSDTYIWIIIPIRAIEELKIFCICLKSSF